MGVRGRNPCLENRLLLRREPRWTFRDAGDRKPRLTHAERHGQLLRRWSADLTALGGDDVCRAARAMGERVVLLTLLTSAAEQREVRLSRELALHKINDTIGALGVIGFPLDMVIEPVGLSSTLKSVGCPGGGTGAPTCGPSPGAMIDHATGVTPSACFVQYMGHLRQRSRAGLV